MLLLPIFNPSLGRREKLPQKAGRKEKLAEKVGRREIYPPVPLPSQRATATSKNTIDRQYTERGQLSYQTLFIHR